jgi:hypothetical protein
MNDINNLPNLASSNSHPKKLSDGAIVYRTLCLGHREPPLPISIQDRLGHGSSARNTPGTSESFFGCEVGDARFGRLFMSFIAGMHATSSSCVA